MEKQKRWQLLLILTVIIVTLFNIIPTLFYYARPLDENVSEDRAMEIGQEIVSRLKEIEKNNLAYLKAYCKNLNIKATKLTKSPQDNSLYLLTFSSEEDANLFKKYFNEAGRGIPFTPGRMSLDPSSSSPLSVAVRPHFYMGNLDKDRLFLYEEKFQSPGKIGSLYRRLIEERLFVLIKEMVGHNSNSQSLSYLIEGKTDGKTNEMALNLAEKMIQFSQTFGEQSPITLRFYQQLVQESGGQNTFKQALLNRFQSVVANLETLSNEIGPAQADRDRQKLLESINGQKQTLQQAITLLQLHASTFVSHSTPLKDSQVSTLISQSLQDLDKEGLEAYVSLDNKHPFIAGLYVDGKNGKVFFKPHEDLNRVRQLQTSTEEEERSRDQVNFLLFNEMARLSRESDETLQPKSGGFELDLETLSGSTSFLAFDLKQVAKDRLKHLLEKLQKQWAPKHPDLSPNNFPLFSWDQYQNLPEEQKQLGLLTLAPVTVQESPEGFESNSLYIVAKGLNRIINKISQSGNKEEIDQYLQDWKSLNTLLNEEGFHIRYSGDEFPLRHFENDIIFRQDNYYQTLLTATREDFKVKGRKGFAILEFTNVEQRILTENKIDDKIHEELLTWKQDYHKAQVDLNPEAKYRIPPPPQSTLLANLFLSTKKYIRGDERKILKWGLDLRGGKSVRIALKDQNQQLVTNPADLNQARNELYNRVNKMGVTEVNLHIEGNNIIADFPASQNFSAKELIKASAMYFHIVNEKFGTHNSALANDVQNFLQGVWNEAVVTNQTEIEQVQEIAYKHLTGGYSEDESLVKPTNSYAKSLYEQGLRLPPPQKHSISHSFNDSMSNIAKYRGKPPGGNHPLIIVFNNYALEGSSLKSVQAHYDPTEGHNLSFEVSDSYAKGHIKGSPSEDFFQWTSRFSKDGVKGTPKEGFSKGEGWRMAVILNGQVISSPTLNGSLKHQGRITGPFSQREMSQLAADLKAGSLTFTPQILAEENVSPELGIGERAKGINATILGLVAVVAAMMICYRFAGFISAIAILFNLLIMWGVLQNLNAILTLSGIAGIILTIGMAVDANVLVFERIKEEFAHSGKIASAIQAGYKKAFSAIFDSNITTVIAAFILLQFDSGPIRGFAVTLLIGIVSSMFTALFMTRFYFVGWMQNPKNTELKMANLIHNTHYNFLKAFKPFMTICVLIALAGGYLMYHQRHTILGMDFTGGYAINLDFQEKEGISFRDKVGQLLAKQGVQSGDIQIRELGTPNQLYLQIGRGVDQEGRPFYGMPDEIELQDALYSFEKNPRLSWLVALLDENGMPLKEQTLPTLAQNWKLMSGQLSDAMKNQALLSLGLALLCILIYISLRFEFKYGVSAILTLLNDIIVSMGLLAILNFIGLPIQIDMQVIGAIMTIIGYSLNDTIIVFDRIREDLLLYRKMPIEKVLNQAVNTTLNRTLMTSGTTLLVLIALLLFSGQAIFSFSLIMTIGVIIGTLSSIFISAPFMLYFHQKEQQGALKKQTA